MGGDTYLEGVGREAWDEGTKGRRDSETERRMVVDSLHGLTPSSLRHSVFYTSTSVSSIPYAVWLLPCWVRDRQERYAGSRSRQLLILTPALSDTI